MRLPRDLTRITSKQYRAAVCQLAKQPMAALRKRQARVERAERSAVARGDETSVRQLDVIERITRDAVFENEFGPVLCRR